MTAMEQKTDKEVYSRRKLFLSVIVAAIGAAGTLIAIWVGSGFFSPRTVESQYVIRVVEATTNSPISNGHIAIDAGSVRLREVSDSDGVATFKIPTKTDGLHGALAVEAEGFKPQYETLTLPQQYRGVYVVPLTRNPVQVNTEGKVPYKDVFSIGPVPSGQGGNFSGWYEVVAQPPKPGYVIDVDQSSYYVAGDRQCNAWSECVWGDRSPTKLSFRFRLQGHSEYPPPGVAMSQGFLQVVYKPE
jgi:hypothetical protein